MMFKMLVSIVVPIYKVEQYLRECVDSILNQTYENLQVILVDDGSPDRCGEIIEAYKKVDSRIVTVHKENGGLSDARNYGIERAKGNYIICVDSDDRIHKEMVEKLYEAILEKDAEIAVCDMLYFEENGKTSISSGGSFTCTNAKEYPQLVAINNSACNKMYLKSLFEEVKFVN